MRAKASSQAITAFATPALKAAALAALSLAMLQLLSPPPLHAHPTHTLRKTTLRTPAPTPPKQSGKAAARPKLKPKLKAKRHKRQSVDDAILPTLTRIRVPLPKTQATPSDFLHAAATPAPVVSIIRPIPHPPALPSIQQAAATPVLLPPLYTRRGRLIVPAPLKGSHEILLHQNIVADREGLDRIRDDDDLLDLRDSQLLVPIPTGRTLLVDERLPSDRRYCRPWTAQFLSTVSSAYYARFHTPLQVNSAVRTVEFQQRLLRTNGNAAPAQGDTASPHLTGQAVDLAKHGLTLTQIAWLRGYLRTLVQQSKIDVEEEFQQACFHISVYKKYLPPTPTPAPRRNLASTHNAEATALTPSED